MQDTHTQFKPFDSLNILKDKYKLFLITEYHKDFCFYIFYINDAKLSSKFKLKHAMSSIEILHNINSDIISIPSLITNTKYRKNGFASYLILTMAKYCIDFAKIIELDDMSDFFNQKNNIYTKHGFLYINSNFGPEMISNPTTIISNINNFKSKYTNNNFFKNIKIEL